MPPALPPEAARKVERRRALADDLLRVDDDDEKRIAACEAWNYLAAARMFGRFNAHRAHLDAEALRLAQAIVRERLLTDDARFKSASAISKMRVPLMCEAVHLSRKS